MAKNDAELMRALVEQIEKSQKLMHDAVQVDEDITRFRRTTQWLKGIFSKQARGVADVLKGAVPFLKLFERYLGRKNQTYDTVTWLTILLFLQGPAAKSIPVGNSRGVPLSIEQVSQLLNDVTFRRAVYAQLQKEKLLTPGFNNWFPTSHTLAAKKSAFVGGPEEEYRGRRSEVIVHNLLEMAVSMMFDLVDADAAPDTVGSAGGARAAQRTPTAGAAAAPPAPAAAPAASPPSAGSPTVTPAQLAALQSILNALRGRTP